VTGRDIAVDLVRAVREAYESGRRAAREELEAARARVAELEAELRRRTRGPGR